MQGLKGCRCWGWPLNSHPLSGVTAIRPEDLEFPNTMTDIDYDTWMLRLGRLPLNPAWPCWVELGDSRKVSVVRPVVAVGTSRVREPTPFSSVLGLPTHTEQSLLFPEGTPGTKGTEVKSLCWCPQMAGFGRQRLSGQHLMEWEGHSLLLSPQWHCYHARRQHNAQ